MFFVSLQLLRQKRSLSFVALRQLYMTIKNKKITGIICGIAAAVCYGTNPLGALNLYAEGLTTNVVLFYRFGFALLLITALLLWRHEKFAITKKEFWTLLALGVLFTFSSLTLYSSFNRMDAGVASTILFVYPVMTAVLMAVVFKERTSVVTAISIALSMVGVALLYWRGNGQTLDTWGVVLVLISALTYAVYIIVMNRSHLNMSAFKINFFVTLCCVLGMLVYSLLCGMPIQALHTARSWFFVGWLSVVPTIFALVLLVYAAKYAGSTPTAIMGALEPLTAVLIGICVFGEAFSARLGIGIVLILGAVVLLVLGKDWGKKSSAQ